MITTTYKCDRCGHSQEDKQQMWHVKIYCEHVGYVQPRQFHFLPDGDALWCRKCVDELGLLSSFVNPSAIQATPPPTLEDQIREIVREEVAAAR